MPLGYTELERITNRSCHCHCFLVFLFLTNSSFLIFLLLSMFLLILAGLFYCSHVPNFFLIFNCVIVLSILKKALEEGKAILAEAKNAERSAMLSFQEKSSTLEVYTKVFYN